MPTLALTTNRAVDDIPLATKGRMTWYGTELTGFCVRAGTTSKTFYLWRRVAGREQATFIRLGRVGEITLQKARPDAQQLIGEMVGGSNPVARKRDVTADGMTLREAWQLTKERDEEEGQVAGHVRGLRIQAEASGGLARPAAGGHDAGDLPEAAQRDRRGDGTYTANGTVRVLRAIWRRARRQHRAMPERPTSNVDFFAEHGRTAVITDWPSWWDGVQQIGNAARRDFYVWLAFSGCRAGESMSMEVARRSRKWYGAVSDHQDQGVPACRSARS